MFHVIEMGDVFKNASENEFYLSSIVDESVVDVDQSNFREGTKIWTWPYNGTIAQIFTAKKEDLGCCIAACRGAVFPEGLLVMDENQCGNIQLSKFTGAESQQWIAVPVKETPNCYNFVNASNQRYLTNIGIREQLKTLPKNNLDNQNWMVKPVKGPDVDNENAVPNPK